jgi:hypothetical protein
MKDDIIGEDTMREYLRYFASHLIIISDNIKNKKIKEDDFSILAQYFGEMGESLHQVIEIINKDGDLYKGLEGEDPTKIIRDFKIDRIMNERNR